MSRVHQFVCSCDACHQLTPLSTSIADLSRSIRKLFEVFSIGFTGPIQRFVDGGPQYTIISVEYMTNWPFGKVTGEATENKELSSSRRR